MALLDEQGSMNCMHDSVEAVTLLQPDWLRKRTAEAGIWAKTVLSKASVVQVIRQKLLRGEPSAQLRSTVLNPAAFGAESFRGTTRNIPHAGRRRGACATQSRIVTVSCNRTCRRKTVVVHATRFAFRRCRHSRIRRFLRRGQRSRVGYLAIFRWPITSIVGASPIDPESSIRY